MRVHAEMRRFKSTTKHGQLHRKTLTLGIRHVVHVTHINTYDRHTTDYYQYIQYDYDNHRCVAIQSLWIISITPTTPTTNQIPSLGVNCYGKEKVGGFLAVE